MLVTLITHPGDRELTLNLCRQISILGGARNHECLIVTPNQTDLSGIEDVLRGVFGKTSVLRYTATMQGWPYGANEAAHYAMAHIFESQELQYHYVMLEPDCVPRDKRWIDILDIEYRRCGQPILGVRVPTIEIATGRQVGTHTVGVAVYPNNFPQLCPLVRNLSNMTREYQLQNVMPMPWDAYFGPYTSRMTADTDLIQHLVRKRNVGPDGRVFWDCLSLQHAVSQVKPNSILIHGSKDPQFISEITGTLPPPPVFTTPVVPQPERINHAAQTREEKHPIEHQGDAQRETIREGSSLEGQENRRQNGSGGGDGGQSETKVVTSQKVLARQRAQAEQTLKELGIEFPLGTPECRRALSFHSDKWTWPKIKQYASKLRIPLFKKTKHNVINEIVRIELEQGIEPWVQELKPTTPVPVEEAPQPPPGSFALSRASQASALESVGASQGHTDTNGNPVYPQGGGISEEKKARMREMLAKRHLLNV